MDYPSPDYPINEPKIAAPSRESEVQRELSQTHILSNQINKQIEELVQRLASVISPRGEQIKDTEDIPVSTQLASDIKNVNDKLRQTKKTIDFILSGLEL